MGEYMGTHPIFESDFDCLTDRSQKWTRQQHPSSLQKLPKFSAAPAPRASVLRSALNSWTTPVASDRACSHHYTICSLCSLYNAKNKNLVELSKKKKKKKKKNLVWPPKKKKKKKKKK